MDMLLVGSRSTGTSYDGHPGLVGNRSLGGVVFRQRERSRTGAGAELNRERKELEPNSFGYAVALRWDRAVAAMAIAILQ